MVSKLTKKPENSSTGMAVTGPTNVATCQRNTILHHYINIRQNMHFLLMALKCIDNEANCSHTIKHMTEQYQMSQTYRGIYL